MGDTVGIIGDNSKLMNTIASVLGLYLSGYAGTLEWTDHFSGKFIAINFRDNAFQ